MDEVQFKPTNPDDVIAVGKSRKVRRRVVGGAALAVIAILGGTGAAMATGTGFSPATSISPATTGYSTPACPRITPGSGLHIGRKAVTGNTMNIGNVCSTAGGTNINTNAAGTNTGSGAGKTNTGDTGTIVLTTPEHR